MKAALLLAAALALAGCSTAPASVTALPDGGGSAFKTPSDLLGSPPLKLGSLQVSLFDAPLSLKGLSINIAMEGVQLLNGGNPTNWLNFSPEDVVDLLKLQSHSHDLKGDAPVGSYTGVRILIDPTSSNVTLNGFRIPIVWGTPDHPITSGVVDADFNVAFSVGTTNSKQSGAATRLALDFNVQHSVVFKNGAIYIQPATTAANNAGDIHGQVLNKGGKPVTNATVNALDGSGKIINSGITDATGTYYVHALPAGRYTIAVSNNSVTKSGSSIVASGNDPGAAPSMTVTVASGEDVGIEDMVD